MTEVWEDLRERANRALRDLHGLGIIPFKGTPNFGKPPNLKQPQPGQGGESASITIFVIIIIIVIIIMISYSNNNRINNDSNKSYSTNHNNNNNGSNDNRNSKPSAVFEAREDLAMSPYATAV